MGLGGQFLLLLWKNWTVSRRRICATVFEIVLPIAFALLMLAIRNLVEVTDHPDPSMYDPFEVNNLQLYIPRTRKNILYTPNATKINTIMGSLQTTLGNNATVNAYNSMAAIDKYLETNKDGVWAVIAFDSGLDYSSSLPFETKYTLRVARLDSKKRWQTNLQYPFFQNPGPRNNDSNGGTPDYLTTGFLSLQYAINKAIIDEHNPGNNLSDVTISLQKMAYPPFVDDALLTVLQSTLPLFLILAYIVTVFQTTKNIVIEKETRLKEAMKLMGLNPTIYWLSWFTKVLIYLIITCLVFTIIFAVKVGGNSVLNKSDPSLIFVFLLLFGISITFFCFMMSSIFQTANAAAYAAGVIYYMFFVPNYFLSDQYDTMSTTEKLLTCLLNNMSMTFGVISITLYEGTGEGAKWSNFHEPATVEDNFSLLHAMMMLVIDSVIYGIVAWYLENVRPGQYGVPRPFYFPFTRNYWCGPKQYREMNDIAANSDLSDTFEEEPTHLPVGVSIIHLRKEFGRGKNKKVAVADTSLNMYEGQITVLLGHNGAGKTTTMSMLTGFIPPSKGTAYLNNCDIRKNIDGVRKSLGLCPQHNILYDVLTVEEHLEFFAKLKNVPSNRMKEEIDKTLKMLGIESKRRSYSSSLSGGQKRKLSVGISLIGDAKVIILDEPTSGMDPAARRETWDILQKFKEGRTIVLTTHFMDEADLLGDRIAIMAEGVVKCCGTSLFLKKRYGAGYHLVAVKTKDCNVSKVTEVIKSHVPKAILESEISAELSYLLPFDESKKFENLFDEIEKRSTELGLSSFGTTATTMEEVFLKVGENAKTEDDDDNDEDDNNDKRRILNGLSNPSFKNDAAENCTNAVEMRAMGESAAAFNSNIVKNKGFTLSFQQFYGMFVKKAIHTWRNRVVTLVQLILPVVYTILSLLTESTTPTSEDEPSLLLDVSQFEGKPIITYGAGKASATPFTTATASMYKNNFASYSTQNFDALSYSTMDDFFVAKAQEIGVLTFRSSYVIGGEFLTDTAFTTYFNGEAFHTPAIALGHMMTTMLQVYTNSSFSIATTNYPMKLALSEKTVSTRALAVGFTVAFLVLFGMAFLTTSFILFLIKERQTGAKHLQKVSGVSSLAYWTSNYCWDLINYCIPVLCILVVFAAFESPAYVEDSRLGIVFLLFFVYGLCCLPFVYVLHFLFTVPATGMVTITMLNIATGLAALLTVFLLNIPSFGTTDIANILDWVFTILFPHYCLGQSLSDMYTNYDTIKSCEAVNYKTLCEVYNQFPCCSGCTDNCYKFDENYLAWEKPGILRNIVFMLIQCCVYFLLVFFIEVGAINRIGYAFKSKKSISSFRPSIVDVQDENNIEGNVQEDSDVKAERLRIDQSAVTSLMETDALLLKNLEKSYGGYHAVKGISVGVAQQECFGLLGQNGAGKTTTFKMLTGDVFVSHGNAYLNAFDVKHHLRQVQQNLGYCPQFDALIDQMTGRETLTMYARLRGVQEKQISKVVDNLIDALMLKKYASKNCANYSGGNKRKLSTAIALIGDPPFVLLDEPTTGMDPGARRKLWNVLSAVRASGRTLVLTSHSMEECDALCTKIVIMVNGKFVCLGSPQHLKNKFGHGYTLIMRLGSEKDGVVVAPEPIKNFIKETFPDSEIFDDHQGYIHFQIPDSDIPLARVFGSMENAKDRFDIADYSVHQTTLEQVFLTFTRNQIQPKEKKKHKCLGCCC